MVVLAQVLVVAGSAKAGLSMLRIMGTYVIGTFILLAFLIAGKVRAEHGSDSGP
jgi:hypothetical protein